jgi:hypothetical protein
MLRIFLAFLMIAAALPAAAQPLPRVKGRIVDFDGLTFHLAPEKGAPLAIRLQARTQFMTLQKRPLSEVKTGAYAGATVTDAGGTLTAEEVHLYPEPMRGSSEGRIGLGDGRFVITGTVKASAAGSLTLSYRGGAMTDGVCQGRADPNAASPACAAEAVIQVPPEARIAALTPANRRQLVPGAIATVTIQTDARGARSTPGLILEKP